LAFFLSLIFPFRAISSFTVRFPFVDARCFCFSILSLPLQAGELSIKRGEERRRKGAREEEEEGSQLLFAFIMDELTTGVGLCFAFLHSIDPSSLLCISVN
jgi:hypothetical protein